MTNCLDFSSLSHKTQRKKFLSKLIRQSRVEAFKIENFHWNYCDKDAREFGNVTNFTNFSSFLKSFPPL